MWIKECAVGGDQNLPFNTLTKKLENLKQYLDLDLEKEEISGKQPKKNKTRSKTLPFEVIFFQNMILVE